MGTTRRARGGVALFLIGRLVAPCARAGNGEGQFDGHEHGPASASRSAAPRPAARGSEPFVLLHILIESFVPGIATREFPMASLASNSYAKVDESIRLRGKRLRSRVYLPAHQPGLADNGLPGDRYVEYHRRRARAGLGMRITGATPVLWSEVWADGLTLVNVDDRIIPGYRRLAAAVHGEGGLMLAQLAHAGAVETTGDAVVSASWTRSEITQQTSREATPDELADIAELYHTAALRCRAGDLDGVEVTMAHGMLLASFLSPLMNRRTDCYGGNLDGRTLYPREVVSAVRSAMGPDAIVGIRIPGDELVQGGIGPEGAAVLAERLVRSGEVDYVSVTAGNNTRKLARVDHWPPTPAPLAAFRHLSRGVKGAVQVPVATVGRVTTLALAEDILRSGDADLVGMVRANIADPELLPKSRAGRAASVRPCVGANICINSLLDHKPLTCLANPDVGRPAARIAEGWGTGRRAVVVGGGPAGLEAARRLAIGGWRTILVEREARLGGQIALWSQTPSRIEFLQLVNWWAGECQRLGVDVRTSVEAGVALLTRIAPDLVVVATGSTPVNAPVPQQGDSLRQIGPYDPIPAGGHVLAETFPLTAGYARPGFARRVSACQASDQAGAAAVDMASITVGRPERHPATADRIPKTTMLTTTSTKSTHSAVST